MSKQEEKKVVDITKRVTVYATDKNKYVTTGAPMEVSAVLVEHLVETGMVTTTAPKQTGGK